MVGYADLRFGTSGMEAAGNVSPNGGSPENWLEWGELGRQLVTQDKRAKGRDLVLTLDADLQSLAYQLLGGRPGAVVMLVPADGAVRVLTDSLSSRQFMRTCQPASLRVLRSRAVLSGLSCVPWLGKKS